MSKGPPPCNKDCNDLRALTCTPGSAKLEGTIFHRDWLAPITLSQAAFIVAVCALVDVDIPVTCAYTQLGSHDVSSAPVVSVAVILVLVTAVEVGPVQWVVVVVVVEQQQQQEHKQNQCRCSKEQWPHTIAPKGVAGAKAD